jgi:hypothetical protein
VTTQQHETSPEECHRTGERRHDPQRVAGTEDHRGADGAEAEQEVSQPRDRGVGAILLEQASAGADVGDAHPDDDHSHSGDHDRRYRQVTNGLHARGHDSYPGSDGRDTDEQG